MRAFWAALWGAVLAALVVAAAPTGAATSVPTVTSFTPTLGAVSAVVTVAGSRFTAGATVAFNGHDSVDVHVLSASKLTAAVPAGATTGPIAVTTAGGTGQSRASFTVAATPGVAGFLPTSGTIGTSVTLTGSSFTGATGVSFNGVKASFRVLSSTSIKTTVPKGVTDGPISVSIPGATGTSLSSFDAILPPTIASFSPVAGIAGDTVTIDGADFTDGSTVKIGGVLATVTSASTTELQVTVPAGVKTGKVTVTTPIGTATSNQSFFAQALPKITGFTPTAGGSGTVVAISGSGFATASDVEFGGNPAASFQIVGDTKIDATVGPDAGAGTISVTNEVGTTESVKQFAGAPFVVRAELDYAMDSIDPAVSYFQPGWEMEYSTCLQLVGYPDEAGQPGALLQPDAASAMPLVSDDGLTYTFTIRDGEEFSTGEAVTADTFKKTIERAVDPATGGSGGTFMSDVVGEADYVSGSASDISGLAASGQTLTITLTKNDPDFLARLAMPFFCAVPVATPHAEQSSPIPSAGPYTIDSIDGNTIKLVRNPNYGGTRPAFPDEIDLVQNVDQSTLLNDVVGGTANYTDSLSAADITTAQARYPKQTLTGVLAGGFRYFALNTSRDALGSAAARQAINLVINRTKIVGLYGTDAGTPTDQYLTPGIPGYTDANIYPLNGPSASQLAQAKSLADSSGLTGQTLEYWTCASTVCTSVANTMKTELAQLNVTLNVTQLAGGQLYTQAGTQGAAFDIVGPIGWIPDYPDPYDTLNTLLDGSTITPTNNANLSYFDDPTYNQKLEDAEADGGSDRYANFEALDVDLAQNAAPLAAIGTINQTAFFSSHTGCRTYQPIRGTDFDTLCRS